MRSRIAVVFFLGFVVFNTACGDDGGKQTGPDAGIDAPGDGGPNEMICENLAPVASGTCEVTPGGEAKLIKGNILTPETVFVGGQVAVDAGGQITCVGCNCGGGGETVISCPGASVSPGLINTHDHITFTQNNPYTENPSIRYDSRHQWRKGLDGKPKIPAAGGASGVRISWGELRFVMGGGTSIVGSGGQPGLLRNLDNATQQEGLNHTAVKFDTFPLGDSSGVRQTANCNYGTVVTPDSLMSVKSFEPHTAEGVDNYAQNEFKCESDDMYDDEAPGLSENLVMPKTAMIHGIGLTADNYALMAVKGTGLIWSPRSNITLYGDTARVRLAAALGVEIALGTDWMPTGSMNLLRELRCADEFNKTYLDNYFTDQKLWEMVTLNAAALTATDDAIGLLAPNHAADIAIFKNASSGYRAVVDAEPKDVVLVMRGGVVLYGDDATVAGLTTSCDVVDVCGVSKRVCTKRELGKTYDELQTAVGAIYPPFACGVPMNEPSCVPKRPAATPNTSSTVFTGMITPADSDGDGINDGSDNCPRVFNPIRPMDGATQPDVDSDGTGDACDDCPNDPGTSTCTSINPDDRDHDGVVNAADNCPDDNNPAQTDGDSDGKGDPCDPCPSEANPGNAGCAASIPAIKQSQIPPGSAVSIQNVLVTGKGSNGFFVQLKAGDPGYTGPDFSGLFIYTGTMSPQLANAVVGMRVTVDGTVRNYMGQLEIDPVASVMPTTMVVEAAPTPATVTYAEVKTGGTRALSLDSVLVTLGASSVTAVSATYGEYTITAGAENLIVDDFLYVTPGVAVGKSISAITGILALRQAASKLEPRGAADIAQGAPTLASFGPAMSYVRTGANNVNTFPVGSELTVTLSGPAQGDTIVSLNASTNGVQIPMNRVTVLNGQTTAKVVLSGQATLGNVTITAQLGAGTPLNAVVRVLGATEAATVVTLAPTTAVVTPAGTVTLTATLDIPAPPAGTPVTLSVSPAGAGTVTTLTIPANTLTGTFTYTDVTGAASTVTGQVAASTSTTAITVAAGGNNLMINEVDYDMVGSDVAEFIEIYNPTGAAISLANVGVVLINGSTSEAYPTATSIIDLGTLGSLPAFGYLVIAGSNLAVPSGTLRIDPGWTQDEVQNGVTDGIALVDTATNTLIDALSYEGAVTMAEVPGIANPVTLVEGTVLSGTQVDSNTAPGALCRTPNGTDTDNANADWKFCATITPGSANQ